VRGHRDLSARTGRRGQRRSGSSRPATQAPAPPANAARPPEIEDLTNTLLVHRLSGALLGPALRLGIHPNVVSLGGLAFGVLAAFAYHRWDDWRFATAGLACMVCWHVLDGLDGALARASGRTSAFGRFLDGLCDYLTFILVYCALALSLVPVHGPLLPWCLAIVAGAAHIVQAAAYEGEREAYVRRLARLPGRIVRPPSRNPLVSWYDKLQSALARGSADVDRHLNAERAARRDTLLARYRHALAPRLKRLALLSANNRTIAIWLCCVVAGPELYWAWEILGLSVLGLLLLGRVRGAETALLTRRP
jgi:CDP-diacylglycerol--serine O-phosphatidyltransferase